MFLFKGLPAEVLIVEESPYSQIYYKNSLKTNNGETSQEFVKTTGSDAGLPSAFLSRSIWFECTLLTFAITLIEQYISCEQQRRKEESTAVISCFGNKIMDLLLGVEK